METAPSLNESLPLLLDQLFTARDLRANTPTNQSVAPVLQPVTLTNKACEEMDMAVYRWKQPLPGNPLVDGYEAERQARAIALERGTRRFS